MNRAVHHVALLLLGAAFIGFVGCGPSSTKPAPGSHAAKDDHDHEHGHKEGKHDDETGHDQEGHPATYAEAVKKIDDLRNSVKYALAKNDTEKADKPLHEVGHVLEDVVSLAEKASLDAHKQDEIKKAVEQLFDSFGKVDEKIHGGKGASYEEVSAKVDAAMTTLRQHVPGGK